MIIDINLLPWREKLREEKKRQFGLSVGVVAAVTVLFLIVIHFFLSEKFHHQEGRGDYLEQESKLIQENLDTMKSVKDEKQQIIQRLKLIEDLQDDRFKVVKFLDALSKVMPPSVYLTEIKRKGNQIELQGIAQTNHYVTELVRSLSQYDFIINPALDEIKVEDNTNATERNFTLKLKFSGNNSIDNLPVE